MSRLEESDQAGSSSDWTWSGYIGTSSVVEISESEARRGTKWRMMWQWEIGYIKYPSNKSIQNEGTQVFNCWRKNLQIWKVRF